MPILNIDYFRCLAPVPRAKTAKQTAIITPLAELINPLLTRYMISTPRRIAHFTAQLAHESDAFSTTTEYASGVAYEGRGDLGNVQAGDGRRFRGRGLMQTTGRTNYMLFRHFMREQLPHCPDFVARPELLADMPWALWSAIFYWESKKLNFLADKNDITAITRIINGGRNGLADRRSHLQAAQTYLNRANGLLAACAVAPAEMKRPMA